MTILGPTMGIPSMAGARLQRWEIVLSGHSYEIKFRSTHQHCNADALPRLPLDADSSALQCRCSIQTSTGCRLISIAMQMLYPDFHWMWTHQHCNADALSRLPQDVWTHQHCNADALSRLSLMWTNADVVTRLPLDADSSALQCTQTSTGCGLISIAMQMLYPDFHWMQTHQHCNADALSRLPLDVD